MISRFIFVTVQMSLIYFGFVIVSFSIFFICVAFKIEPVFIMNSPYPEPDELMSLTSQ